MNKWFLLVTVLVLMANLVGPAVVLAQPDVSISVKINEFLSYPTSGDWVELYNASDTEVSLNGWTLSDSTSVMKTFSSGDMLLAHGWLQVSVTNRLDRTTDKIILKNSAGTEIDRVTYGGTGNASAPGSGKSAGRCPDGADTDGDSTDFVVFNTPTPAATNAITFYRDLDSDGYGAVLSGTVAACSAPSGYVISSTDCDDADASTNPGKTEICDGKDNDCDGTIDEGVKNTYYHDADTDGYGDPADSVEACSAPSGYVADDTDCNDGDISVHPNADEVCNGIDEDCDSTTDEGVKTIFYRDLDSDGYGADDSGTVAACNAPSGYVADNTDCNDGDISVHPNGDEVCNEIDDDCDGTTDEGVKTIFYRDADSDGYGAASSGTVAACSAPEGYVDNSTDCNDGAISIHPNAAEACNGIDDDCDTLTDEGFDSDSDGTADCFDSEVCDGLDNDGDGEIDEGVTTTFYRDADHDGFGAVSSGTVAACSAPSGYVNNSTDCSDSDGSVHPGAPEVCGDGIDQDCDGVDVVPCSTTKPTPTPPPSPHPSIPGMTGWGVMAAIALVGALAAAILRKKQAHANR